MKPFQSRSAAVRLVTWNMDHWKRSTVARQEGWRFLRDRVRPDIALLQEACPPDDAGGQVVFREGGMLDERQFPPVPRGWGSAVVSFGPTLRAISDAKSPFHGDRIPLLRTFPGSVAIADVDLDESLVVVSAYGVIDRGYADTTVHRVLSDLTPLLDERRGRRTVIAGDLNITTQWSVKHKGFLKGRHEECLRRDSNLFERFAALGLHNVVNRTEPSPLEGCDCSLGNRCRHVQTQRHERSDFPWQNDYVFVTEDLLPLCRKPEILDDDQVWTLSGHCPIVLEIDPNA